MRLFRKILVFRSSGETRRSARALPECLTLEGRLLLSTAASPTIRKDLAQLNQAYHKFVADLRIAEENSQVTQAEAGALIKDEASVFSTLGQQVAESIGNSSAGLPLTTQQVNQLMEYIDGDVALALFTGWQTDQQWATSTIQVYMNQDLLNAGYTQTQATQFIADARAAAVADGISPQSYTTLSNDVQAYDGIANTLIKGGHTPSTKTDPVTYLSNHLDNLVRRR